MPALTSQQEKFAQCVASGMNQSDAYRAAYKVRPATKPMSVNQQASELMRNPDITSRVEEIRKPIVEDARITLREHLEELRELRELAKQENQLSAAIKAEESRGKACGHYKEQIEHSGKITIGIEELLRGIN